MAKNLILGGPDSGSLSPNLGRLFFSTIWLRQSLDITVTCHHVQYQKNLRIQSWENLVRDGRRDESSFIERCPTDIKPPKRKKCLKWKKLLNWEAFFLLVQKLSLVFFQITWQILQNSKTASKNDLKKRSLKTILKNNLKKQS